MDEKKIITTSVRIDPFTNSVLKLIAEYEGRSVSNLIQRFLYRGASDYLKSHRENAEFMTFATPKMIETLAALGLNTENENTLRSDMRNLMSILQENKTNGA